MKKIQRARFVQFKFYLCVFGMCAGAGAGTGAGY